MPRFFIDSTINDKVYRDEHGVMASDARAAGVISLRTTNEFLEGLKTSGDRSVVTVLSDHNRKELSRYTASLRVEEVP